jgi:hypothetical protein
LNGFLKRCESLYEKFNHLNDYIKAGLIMSGIIIGMLILFAAIAFLPWLIWQWIIGLGAMGFFYLVIIAALKGW